MNLYIFISFLFYTNESTVRTHSIQYLIDLTIYHREPFQVDIRICLLLVMPP